MAATLVTDSFWDFIKDELPPEPPPSPRGGRPRVGNRQALTGILFVLRYGVTWQAIPSELGCGSGSTCWRRFRDWTREGVWHRVQEKLMRQMADAGQVQGGLMVIDSASVRALLGGATPGPTPPTAGRKAARGT